MHPEFPIPCPVCGAGILDGERHRAWHAETRGSSDLEPADHGLTIGDVIAGWLDELDPAAIEQLVLQDATLGTNAVAATIGALRQLAKAET